jgi:hypothetical protein
MMFAIGVLAPGRQQSLFGWRPGANSLVSVLAPGRQQSLFGWRPGANSLVHSHPAANNHFSVGGQARIAWKRTYKETKQQKKHPTTNYVALRAYVRLFLCCFVSLYVRTLHVCLLKTYITHQWCSIHITSKATALEGRRHPHALS